MLKDMFTLSGRWGRLNRLRYFGLALLANLIFGIIIFAFTALSFGIVADVGLGGLGAALILFLLLYLVILWIGICLMVKRLHDLNQTGWWVLGLFGYLFLSGFISGMLGDDGTLSLLFAIPTIAFALWLLFWPGTDGDNQYGPDPKKMT